MQFGKRAKRVKECFSDGSKRRYVGSIYMVWNIMWKGRKKNYQHTASMFLDYIDIANGYTHLCVHSVSATVFQIVSM